MQIILELQITKNRDWHTIKFLSIYKCIGSSNQRFCHFIVTHLNNNDSGRIIFVDHNRHSAENYHLYLHVYHVFSLSYVFFSHLVCLTCV